MTHVLLLLLLALGAGEPYAWLADGWRWSSIEGDAGGPLPPVRDLAVVPGGAWIATDDGLFVWDGVGARLVEGTKGWSLVAADAVDLTRCVAVRVAGGRRTAWLCAPEEVREVGRSSAGDLPADAGFRADGGLWALGERDGGWAVWRTDERGDPLGEPVALGGAVRGALRLVRSATGRLLVPRVGGVFVLEDPAPRPAWKPLDPFAVWSDLAEGIDGTGYGVLTFPPGRAGLFRWDPASSPRRVALEAPARVRALALPPEGGALVVGADGSVAWIAEGRVSRWTTPPATLAAALVLAFDDTGDLLVGGEEGLFLVRRESEPLVRLDSLPTGSEERVVHSIARDGDGYLVATVGGVLRLGPRGRCERLPALPGVEAPIVTSALRDDEGRVWISSGGGFEGVFVLEGGSWRRVLEDVHGHPLGLVHRIRRLSDARGRGRLVLAGIAPGAGAPFAEEGGLYVLEPGGLLRLGTGGELVGARVYDVAEHGGARVVASSRGLFVFGEGGRPTRVVSGRCRAVIARRTTGFAAACGQAVVFLDRSGRLRTYRRLGTGDVVDLVEDEGRIVALAGRTVHRLTEEGPSQPFTLPAAYGPWTCIAACGAGRYLVGSAGGGLFRLDVGSLEGERLAWRRLDVWPEDGLLFADAVPAMRKGRWPADDLLVRWRRDGGAWSDWRPAGSFPLGEAPGGHHRFDFEARHPVTGASVAQTRVVEVPVAAWRRPDVLAAVGLLAAAALGLLLWGASARRRARLLEEARRRHDQRTEQLEAIGRLAAGIAHDFNNVLTALLGTLQMARDEISRRGGDLEQAGRDLDGALAAVQQSIDLTERLVSLARPDGGREDGGTVDLGERLRDAASLLVRLAGDRVRIEVRADRPVFARADRTSVDRILLNLALNAVEAARPAGGRVWLEVEGSGEAARLVVSDDGPGIPRHLRERVFDPFFTTKHGAAERPGVGLGLTAVRDLVVGCGGRVRVEENRHGGARFVVEFPRAPAPGDRGAARPDGPPP